MRDEQLKEVMKFHLRHFASQGTQINDDTIHNTVLSDNDGIGSAHSSRIYRSLIRWTLKQAGNGDPAWPKDWLTLSVSDLAGKLILC
jgi:hypothetical protein